MTGEEHIATTRGAPRFTGAIPPLVTPLLDRDTLDRAGAGRLVAHVLEGGVKGLFILGSTGEGPSLSYRLRREYIERVCRLAAGRAPVLVGVTDTAFAESVRLAHTALEHGAAAVVLSAPYYFPAGQKELLEYIEHMLAELPLPVLLYNMPGLTKVSFEIDTLEKLSRFDAITGVKDSSGDIAYFGELVKLKRERPDWSILMGPEHLLVESMRLGGDGGVNGGANIFPELFVQCCDAVRADDRERADRLQGRISALQALYDIGQYESRFIKATKCALSLLGVCDDYMAEPFHRFRAPERSRVREIIAALEPGALAAPDSMGEPEA